MGSRYKSTYAAGVSDYANSVVYAPRAIPSKSTRYGPRKKATSSGRVRNYDTESELGDRDTTAWSTETAQTFMHDKSASLMNRAHSKAVGRHGAMLMAGTTQEEVFIAGRRTEKSIAQVQCGIWNMRVCFILRPACVCVCALVLMDV